MRFTDYLYHKIWDRYYINHWKTQWYFISPRI